MRWLKAAAIVLGVVLAVAAAVPFLFPVHGYIPQLEKRAGEALGEPVSIADLRLTVLPVPGARAQGIEIGADRAIRIGSLSIHPALLSLFDETKVLRAVVVQGVVIDERLIALLGALAKRPDKAATPSALRVKQVHLRDVRLNLDAIQWGPLRGDVQLGDAGIESVALASEDGHFRLDLQPTATHQALALRAHDWLLPMQPGVRFERLEAAGTLAGSQLTLSRLEARLYGGKGGGRLQVDWGKGWKVQGVAELGGVEVEPLMGALGLKTRLSGQLHASGGYTMAAREPAGLVEGLRATFRFRVNNGVLNGVDLERAVKSLARQGTRGGRTRFDELSGMLQVVGRRYEVRDLRVSAGALSAKGQVNVAPSKALSGTIQVELKGTAGVLAVPLDLAGTVSDPVIYPNPAALAGAAAGTVILGPGVGTSLGSRAGQAIEKLFK